MFCTLNYFSKCIYEIKQLLTKKIKWIRHSNFRNYRRTLLMNRISIGFNIAKPGSELKIFFNYVPYNGFKYACCVEIYKIICSSITASASAREIYSVLNVNKQSVRNGERVQSTIILIKFLLIFTWSAQSNKSSA